MPSQDGLLQDEERQCLTLKGKGQERLQRTVGQAGLYQVCEEGEKEVQKQGSMRAHFSLGLQ